MYLFSFSLFFIFFQRILSAENDKLEISFERVQIDYRGLIAVNLWLSDISYREFKSNFKSYRLLVDTSSFYLTIFPKHKSQFPSIDLEEDIYIKSFRINGTGFKSSVNVKFNNSEELLLKNLSIVVLDNITTTYPDNIDGILGLGFNYEDFNEDSLAFSILEQIHVQLNITYRAYQIKYTIQSEDKGNIIFGVPKMCQDYKTAKCGSCRVLRIKEDDDDSVFPHWHCALDFVKIEHFNLGKFQNQTTSELINLPISFDSGIDHIIVPESFFNKTILKVLEPKFAEGDNLCEVLRNTTTEEISIECNKNNYEILNMISFIINPYVIKIKQSELFYVPKDNKDKVKFVIESKTNGNEFVFGQAVLKKYNVIFDKSNERIRFENDKGELANLTTNIYYLFFFNCMVFIIVSMFLGLFWYFVASCVDGVYKRVKKKKKKNDNLISNVSSEIYED